MIPDLFAAVLLFPLSDYSFHLNYYNRDAAYRSRMPRSLTVEPFIEALFRNPVFTTADLKPAEFVLFQKIINRRTADAQDRLKIFDGIAALLG